MKKFTLALVAVLSAILMCFGMAACSSGVAGNTYVFSDVKIEYPEGTTDEMKTMIEAGLASMKEGMKDTGFKFKDDGTCVSVVKGEEQADEVIYYVQDGNTIYLYETKEEADAGNKDEAEMTLKVNGSKLERSGEEGGVNMTIVFKKK
ncbi:MAG: hypothetical protein K2N23_06380 [Clostridia bacterium]|nr:hypothetical protein [Clostridia bacterium]